MHTSIYRSKIKRDVYLYLTRAEDFSNVPSSLMRIFGPPVHVMDLVLTPRRKLAQEDVLQVMRNLLVHGCHVQLATQEHGDGGVAPSGDDVGLPGNLH